MCYCCCACERVCFNWSIRFSWFSFYCFPFAHSNFKFRFLFNATLPQLLLHSAFLSIPFSPSTKWCSQPNRLLGLNIPAFLSSFYVHLSLTKTFPELLEQKWNRRLIDGCWWLSYDGFGIVLNTFFFTFCWRFSFILLYYCHTLFNESSGMSLRL